MKRISLFVTALCLAATLVASALPAAAKPLPSDPRVEKGKLDNGVTWVFRKHDNPPGKLFLMIHIDAGSLNETEAQRGLAHFMEHMVFNGTEHYPPGELIPFFESIGMEFGADLNAFTSFDQTAYMVFLPDTEPDNIDKAMTVLSDYAFRASLIEEEIDKERGVILEEARTGKNAQQRMRDELWPELFEGTRFARRLPIGDEEVIANAPRSEFVDFYRTWYRPENTTVLVVGDVEKEKVLPYVTKWFGQYKPDVPTRKAKGAEFKPFTERRAMVVTDPEMARCEVQMLNIRPGRKPTATVEQFRTELVEYIGTWIMDRRFEDRVQKGEATYSSAGAGVMDFFNDAMLSMVTASGEKDDWPQMLTEAVTEINRARKYGFSDRELELAKKEILADAERTVRTEPTRNARGVLFEIMSSVNDEEPVLSAQQEHDLYAELLPTIKLNEVNDTFKKHFEPGTFAYVVEMVEEEGEDDQKQEAMLAAAATNAWETPVDPFKEDETPTELLASLPEPGKAIEQSRHKETGITHTWLSNGVRVHYRFMDYKKDNINVSIALAGGGIEETAQNAGITTVASLAIDQAATNRLSSTNIRDIMTGKNINVGVGRSGMSPGSDSLTLTVTGSPEDLEAGLQLAHALLTDGKIEESAFKNWRIQTLQQLEMMKTMPQFRVFKAMLDLISGGDPRVTMITKEDVERQSLEAAQKWFDRLRTEAPIEVAVVGDMQLNDVMPLIERYLGSLPQRPRTADGLDKLRKLGRPTGPLSRHVEVETMTPQGMAMAGFIAAQGDAIEDVRALNLASHILSTRLIKSVREDQSLVYSIRAFFSPSWIFEDGGTFAAGAPCDPGNVKKVSGEVHRIFSEFAKEGPTEEELENAKKQEANNLDTEMKEPRYWWRILQHHDLHHRDLNAEAAEKEAYDSFTAEQVQKVFAKYYKPEREFVVTAVPVKPTEEGSDQEKTENKEEQEEAAAATGS